MSLRDLWADLSIPAGADQRPGARAATACGHAVIGAFAVGCAVAAGLPHEVSVLAVWIIYWAAKELPDMRSGGARRDSVIDAAFVALGGALAPSIWWGPVLALAAADGAWGKRLRGAV